jgi:hypothetical protein
VNDLDEVPESSHEADSINHSHSQEKSRSQFKRSSFFVPEDSFERSQNGEQGIQSIKHTQSVRSYAPSNTSAIGSTKSKIRRYGKRKFQTEDELR